MHWAYLFEANSLQGYIFATGKLRDVSGASELIADLAFEPAPGDMKDLRSRERLAEWPRSLADAAHGEMEKLAPGGSGFEFFRHAGGALEIADTGGNGETLLRNFRDRWRIFVARHVPGLDFVDAIGSGDSADAAIADGRDRLASCAPFALLGGPPASPLSRPASRTGMPAVYDPHRTHNDGTCKIVVGEHVDLATTKSRWFLRRRGDRHVLPGLFGGFGSDSDYIWPVIIGADDEPPTPEGEDPVPASERAALFEPVDAGGMPDERRTLAVVHIDGNGIGNLFVKAQELQATKQLSEAMNTAMVLSARKAVRDCLLTKLRRDPPSGKDIVPARPVLLGGDDLTILVRGDLALDFAETFARAYSGETARALKGLKSRGGVDVENMLCDFLESGEGIGARHPTVKAGIAIIGARQPFARAYRLAEALSGVAGADGKDKARISLWRVTGAHIPQTAEELVAQTERDGRSTWRQSWVVGDKNAAAPGTTGALRNLVEAMANRDVGGGALREVAELWLDDSSGAERLYRRALDQIGQRAGPDIAKKLEDAVQAAGTSRYTPLLDAHNLAALGSI